MRHPLGTSRTFPSQPTESVTCAPFCPPSSFPVTAAPTRSCLSPSKPSSQSAGYVEIARPRPRPPPSLALDGGGAEGIAGEGEGDSLESSIVDFVVQCYFEYIMYRDSLGSPSSSDGAGEGGGQEAGDRFRASGPGRRSCRGRRGKMLRRRRLPGSERRRGRLGLRSVVCDQHCPPASSAGSSWRGDTKSLDLDPTPSSGRRLALGGCLHKKGLFVLIPRTNDRRDLRASR
jgi:hypothetical protein